MTANVHGPEVTVPQLFAPALAKANQWLSDIRAQCDLHDLHQAYTLLRALFFTIRDWSGVLDNISLAEKLPTLLRGIYYEGWKAVEPRDEGTPCVSSREIDLSRSIKKMTKSELVL